MSTEAIPTNRLRTAHSGSPAPSSLLRKNRLYRCPKAVKNRVVVPAQSTADTRRSRIVRLSRFHVGVTIINNPERYSFVFIQNACKGTKRIPLMQGFVEFLIVYCCFWRRMAWMKVSSLAYCFRRSLDAPGRSFFSKGASGSGSLNWA